MNTIMNNPLAGSSMHPGFGGSSPNGMNGADPMAMIQKLMQTMMSAMNGQQQGSCQCQGAGGTQGCVGCQQGMAQSNQLLGF
jgi:hypothetical protein